MLSREPCARRAERGARKSRKKAVKEPRESRRLVVARADVLGLGEERGGPEEQHGSGDSQFSDDEGVTRLPAMTILEMGDMSPHMVLAPSIEA